MTHVYRLPRFLAALAGLLGAAVILGWHTASPTIVQISPSWAPMQYNTALCMLLAAAMLYADWKQRPKVARLLASLVIALPLATITQYLANVDFGIDQFFITPFVETQTSHPGRMAPNTALAFIMLGATGWLRPERRVEHLILTTFASLTLWLSLLALLGYLSNLTPAYGWGSLTAMAAHTAIGICLISTAILLTAFSRYRGDAPIEWQLACAAPLILMLILAFQLVPIRNSEIWREEKTAADLALLEQHVYLKLNWLHLILNKQFTGLPSSEPNTHFSLEKTNGEPVLRHQNSGQIVGIAPLQETLHAFSQTHNYSYQLSTAEGELIMGAANMPRNAYTGHFTLRFGDQQYRISITPKSLASNSRLAETGTFVLILSLTAILGFIVLIRSIRNRSLAEARAAALYNSFKQAINTFTEGFAIVGPDGIIKDKNTKLSKPNAAHLCDLIEAKTARELLDYLYAPRTKNLTLKTQDREGQPVAVNLAQIPGSSDFVLTTVDLRDAVGKLRAIEYQQALITSAFDASTNGLCVVDGTLNILQANDTLLKWLGDKNESVNGRRIESIIVGDEAASFINELAAISTEPSITQEYEIELQTLYNNRSWMQARGASRFSPDSKTMLITISLKCIDQQKKLVNQLNETIKQLSKSNQELDQFAYVASHDLKSPLVGIKNISDWLDEDYRDLLPEDGKKHLQLIRSRCKRMMTLLDDLLQYSRAGRLDKGTENIELQSFAQDIVNMYDIKQSFTLHCDKTTIRAPKVPLETLLRNLINNSIKHHSLDNGNIFIDACHDENGVTLTYSDDGPGIPEQYYSNVLKPFTTLAPKDKTEGSGMGLAIISKIADSLQGELHLDRGPHGGLAVYFWFPNLEGDENEQQ